MQSWALDKDGKFIGLRGTNISNVGAHTIAFVPLRKARQMSGVYDIPAVYFRGCARSQHAPTTPYRSAGPARSGLHHRALGRPPADQWASIRSSCGGRISSADRDALHQRRGQTYDNGEYEKGMDAALRLADWNGFPTRRAEAKKRGKLRGIGIGITSRSRAASRASAPSHGEARRPGRLVCAR